MDSYHRPRRFLLDTPPGSAPPGPQNSYGGGASFDANMIIILSALLCALICALGINAIVRFFLRCTRRVSSDAAEQTPSPLRYGGKGLEKGLLRQIPVAVYGSDNGVAFTECAICLGEFVDGEKIRVLPKCHHCFHLRCVDIWLASHSTCPTCRQSLAECCGGEAVVEVSGGQVGDGDGDASAAGSGSADEVG
ncbi:hypothetical protein CDL12_23262 [Handroanthus impetiginosus]|uniref:RING-type E3 ubiquitin transferase n=1 Tax=Handroanthus impetiginosus TaxID=429701 RepID=A0A2G9GFY8_9LAMI|nr:hypothetical protein CDL12_23262 [Handroanthus impetiginosus]